MNHLESAFKGKNSLWRYIVMIVAILIIVNTLGAIPLFIGYGIKVAADPAIIGKITSNPSGIMSVLDFDLNIGLLIMLFPFVTGILAFALLVKPLHWRTVKQTINGTGSIRWRRFFVSGLVWAIISGLYLIVYIGIEPSNFTLNNASVTLIYLIIISLLFVPFQAAFEEVLFRGYLMQGLAVLVRNRWFPLIITSILFALMHALNPEVKEYGFMTMMPQYLLFGLVFGIASLIDDGIEVAMGAHTANNIFLCIFVTNSSSALQTSALYVQKNIYPWTEFAGLLIGSIIFIIILKLIFKWDFSVMNDRDNSLHNIIDR
jgi:membrane protease YdiL (CAAX protease family)